MEKKVRLTQVVAAPSNNRGGTTLEPWKEVINGSAPQAKQAQTVWASGVSFKWISGWLKRVAEAQCSVYFRATATEPKTTTEQVTVEKRVSKAGRESLHEQLGRSVLEPAGSGLGRLQLRVLSQPAPPR